MEYLVIKIRSLSQMLNYRMANTVLGIPPVTCPSLLTSFFSSYSGLINRLYVNFSKHNHECVKLPLHMP